MLKLCLDTPKLLEFYLCLLFLGIRIEEEDSGLPVFTFVQKGDCLTEAEGISDGTLSENGIVYLTISEDNVVENGCGQTTSYFVQHDGSVAFDTSTVLNSEIKILTLENKQYFYIPEDDDDEFIENGQPIEQQLITSQITADEQAINEITSSTTAESSNFSLNDETTTITEEAENAEIKLSEPYEMIMVNNDLEYDHLDNPDGDPLASTEAKKKFKCLYKGCEKSYSTSQHLTVHMRNHMNSKPFPCSFSGCGKKFATNYSLTAHRRTHTGEKPYTCQVCSKSFKTSGDLLKHARIHTGEKPFMCPIEGCGKSFTTSNIRKVHVRSHTGERPYVCDYPNCGKAFASSTNYKNHARIHSGEKPYVCSVKDCDKKFTEYSSLYKHQAVHQAAKPYDCDYCSQKFKSEYTLNVHRKVKHGVVVSPNGIELLDLVSIGLASTNP